MWKSFRHADGCSHERLYAVYNGMIQRCHNKKHHGYQNWGGRGIKVCDEWRYDYQAFKRWAIYAGYDESKSRKEQTLDRIDNDGNYCPENCRWTSQREQNLNQRPREPYSQCKTFWTFEGVTKSSEEWCDIFNVTMPMVLYRIRVKHMSPFLALISPPTRGKFATKVTEEQVMELIGRGMTVKQIADLLGCSLNTVRRRIHSARKANGE